MPSYHYHLKFELFPTEDPSVVPAANADPDNIWVPNHSSTIFDELPSHSRKTNHSLSSRQRQKKPTDVFGTSPAKRPQPPGQTGVIDCGPSNSREPLDNGAHIVKLSERQWRERSKSFPPPGFAAGLGPKTATKDGRFGPLSIESFDLAEPTATPTTNMADHITPAPTPAASLGPSFGGPGQSTKAKYIPLETKNTEIGWGIVHLYREGAESSGFGDPIQEDEDAGGAGRGEDSDNGDDGTILCIPAVPSYLSPSDFLGYIGEKWRAHVSHYRMVMTSRMNRYMVLMKFRDHKLATEWRKEFDGHIFNSVDVSSLSVPLYK